MLLSSPAMLMLAIMANENRNTKNDRAEVIFPKKYEQLRESVGQELESWGYIKDFSLHGENGFSCTLLKQI